MREMISVRDWIWSAKESASVNELTERSKGLIFSLEWTESLM